MSAGTIDAMIMDGFMILIGVFCYGVIGWLFCLIMAGIVSLIKGD